MNSDLDTSRHRWDLSPLLTGLNDPRADQDAIEVRLAHEKFASRWLDRADYLHDPAVLLAALTDYETLCAEHAISGYHRNFYGKAGYYFWLREEQDNTDPEIKAKRQRAANVVLAVQKITEFFRDHSEPSPRTTRKFFSNILSSMTISTFWSESFLKRAIN